MFDFSEYPRMNPLFDEKNKKVIGKMKDETNGYPIYEFCGLRSKMYSVSIANGKEKKVAKGVKRALV